MSFLIDPPQTTIRTDRLIFRKLDRNDIDTWMDYFNSAKAVKFMGLEVGNRSQCEAFIERQLQRYENGGNGLHALINKSTGKMVGQCGLLIQEVDGLKELEIGYHLLPRYWGKGYATEAAIACRDLAFENNFSDSLISIIDLENYPSQNVARRNDMKVDKQTYYRYHNVSIYRIKKKEWEKIVKRSPASETPTSNG